MEAAHDVILMDVRMNDMDGPAAAGRIRRAAPFPCDIPIVALTAHAVEGDRERFLGQGTTGYPSKPVLTGQLSRVLAEAAQDVDASRGDTAGVAEAPRASAECL